MTVGPPESASVHVETMRAFVAVNLDVVATRRLADIGRRLRSSELAPPASYTSPPKLHVTLSFFGVIDVGLAPALADALRPLAAGKSAVRVRIARLTAFPSQETARVVVAELEDPSGDFARFHDEFDARCDGLGFARDPRPYRPHVTLARTRDAVDVNAWLGAEAVERGRMTGREHICDAIATEVVLFRSDLARSGAEYTPLFRESFTITRASRRSERPSKKPSRRPSVPVEDPERFPVPPRVPSEPE
jgi:RNA 2',3'-cyclic 3'-phosphodiesterase